MMKLVKSDQDIKDFLIYLAKRFSSCLRSVSLHAFRGHDAKFCMRPEDARENGTLREFPG